MTDEASAPRRSRRRLWLSIALAVPLLLAAGAFAAVRYAADQLRLQVLAALGPESTVGAVELDWNGVVVRDLAIRGPKGWPVRETLRADRIELVPDLRALLSGEYRVAHIHIERPYLSAVRTPEGRLRVLPSLLEKPKQRAKAAGTRPPVVTINRVTVRQASADFFDATISQPAHRVRLKQLDAEVGPLVVPALTTRTKLKLATTIRGPAQDGTASIEGWARFANRDSELVTILEGVDLVVLEPYLLRASETGVEKGGLDLMLESTVDGNHLHAPGTLTLTRLQLKPGGSTFMGMSRSSVVAGFKNRDNRITVKFTLDGDLGDPNFTLNGSLYGRVSLAVAKSLGLSIAGVGTATWEGMKSMGKAIGGWFKSDDKPPEGGAEPEQP